LEVFPVNTHSRQLREKLRGVVRSAPPEALEALRSELRMTDNRPDRSNVPQLAPPHMQAHRALRPVNGDHSRAELEERFGEHTWNAAGGEACGDWIRGYATRDVELRQHAEARIVARWGAGAIVRADTEEGAAGALGAMSAGTGGTLIPRPLEAIVMVARDKVGKMRSLASIYNMTRLQHNIPTAGSMTVAQVSEGATSAQGEPDFGQVPLIAHKSQTRARATVEMLADSSFHIAMIYAQRAGSAFAANEDVPEPA
jgi:HK97 family phage major capsid protein